MTEGTLEAFLAGVERRAFALAHAALWDREAAREVVQDSMLRLVQYYRHRPPAQWPPLFRTVLNSRINEARRRRLAHKARVWLRLGGQPGDSGGDDPPGPEPAAPEVADLSGPEAAAHDAALAARVRAAVGALSLRQRQVFALREWEGLNVRETAAALGCSENAVKQHHFRALAALRRALDDVWQELEPEHDHD